MLYLNGEFKEYFSESDPFKVLQRLEGKVYRQVKSRKTFQFEHNGMTYFAKLHDGVGWLEIFKNLIRLKLPVLGARVEWDAIKRLNQISIATMNVVGFGQRGWNPAKIQSFIITEDLRETISLEEFCLEWTDSPPAHSIRRALIKEVARIASVMHSSGISHRDFYLCHFLLHKEAKYFPKLSLIDLHRAIIQKRLSRRWIIKDIAGLYYSAMQIGLSKRDLLRFALHYSAEDKELAYRNNIEFWAQVEKRADNMFKRLGPAR